MSGSESNKSIVMQALVNNTSAYLNAGPSRAMVNMINPFTKKWERIGMDMPSDRWVFNIRSQEIRDWIEEQPVHMWKHYDVPLDAVVSVNALVGDNYIFTDEMEAWFQLRWS